MSKPTASEIAASVEDWVTQRSFRHVDVTHMHQSESRFGHDYKIEYQLIFLPHSLRRARLEIWVTDDGATAIGVENWGRISERLELQSPDISRLFVSHLRSQINCGGFEPRFLSIKELIQLCDTVAAGQLTITVYQWRHRMIGCEFRLARVKEPGMQVAPNPLIGLGMLFGVYRATDVGYDPW